jgi:hypothetical protein
MDVEVNEWDFGHGRAQSRSASGRSLRALGFGDPSGPSETIPEMLVLLLVLVPLIALAAASFFRHMLAAFLVLLAIPVFGVLNALIGASYAAFAIAGVAIFAALIQTITSSLALLRDANAAPRRPLVAEDRTSTRRSNRSRLVA